MGQRLQGFIQVTIGRAYLVHSALISTTLLRHFCACAKNTCLVMGVAERASARFSSAVQMEYQAQLVSPTCKHTSEVL